MDAVYSCSARVNPDRLLAERFAAIEHQFDCGPLRVWESAGYFQSLFVVFDVASHMSIGALYRAGLVDSIDAAGGLIVYTAVVATV